MHSPSNNLLLCINNIIISLLQNFTYSSCYIWAARSALNKFKRWLWFGGSSNSPIHSLVKQKIENVKSMLLHLFTIFETLSLKKSLVPRSSQLVLEELSGSSVRHQIVKFTQPNISEDLDACAKLCVRNFFPALHVDDDKYKSKVIECLQNMRKRFSERTIFQIVVS